MIRKNIFFTFLIASLSLYSQNLEVPAPFRSAISTAENDSVKASIYLQIGKYYLDKEEIEKSLKWFQALDEINTEQYDLDLIRAASYDFLTEILMTERPNNPLAIDYLQKALKIYTQSNSDKYLVQLGTLYLRLASLNWNLKNPELAHAYLDSAIVIGSRIPDGFNKIKVYVRVSQYYQNINLPLKCIEYGDSCINISRRSNYEDGIVRGFRMVAEGYKTIKKYDLALQISDSVTKYGQKLGYESDMMSLCYDLNTRGKILFLMNSQSEALKYFNESLNLAIKIDHRKWMVINYYDLSNYYFQQKNYKKANKYALELLDLAIEEQYYNDMLKSYRLLADLSIKMGNSQLAYSYLLKYIDLKEEIFPSVKSSSIATALYRREIDKHGKLYQSLNESNELKDALLKKAAKKSTFLSIILAVFIILLIAGFWQYSRIQRQKKLLHKKNQHIEEQNQEIASVNEELSSNVENLSKIIDERNDLIAVVSHDLKSPLNRALGLTQVISTFSDNFTSDQKDLFAKLEAELFHERQLIADILDAETLENELLFIKIEPINVVQSIYKSVDGFKTLAQKKNISIHLNLPENEVVILANEVFFNRIIENLISNAIKFSASDTKIKISVSDLKSQTLIEIQDQGQGFSEDDQRNLFRRYHKLSAVPTGDENSTGLGLSIVKRLIDAMNGNIQLISAKNEGATFILKFPKA